jgi:hypothetical protein
VIRRIASVIRSAQWPSPYRRGNSARSPPAAPRSTRSQTKSAVTPPRWGVGKTRATRYKRCSLFWSGRRVPVIGPSTSSRPELGEFRPPVDLLPAGASAWSAWALRLAKTAGRSSLRTVLRYRSRSAASVKSGLGERSRAVGSSAPILGYFNNRRTADRNISTLSSPDGAHGRCRMRPWSSMPCVRWTDLSCEKRFAVRFGRG